MDGIFEWNENKRLSNIRKHGIDFLRKAGVFGPRRYLRFLRIAIMPSPDS